MKDPKNKVSRRKLLSTVTGAGVLTIGLNGTSVITSGQSNRVVKKPSADERKSIIAQFRQDSKVRDLLQKLRADRKGWHLDVQSGQFRSITTADGTEYDAASIPLNPPTPSNGVKGAITWTNSLDPFTKISILDQSNQSGDGVSSVTEEVYAFDDGDIVVNSELIEFGQLADETGRDSSEDVSGQDYITPIGGGGVCYRCGCQEVVTEHCIDYNVSCLGIMLATLGFSCNPYTGYVACFLGVSVTGLLPWVTGDNCDICDEYDVDVVHIGYACEYDDPPEG